jgi:hypothetical protein
MRVLGVGLDCAVMADRLQSAMIVPFIQSRGGVEDFALIGLNIAECNHDAALQKRKLLNPRIGLGASLQA